MDQSLSRNPHGASLFLRKIEEEESERESEFRDLHTVGLGDVKRMNNFFLTKHNMVQREVSLSSPRMDSTAWEDGPCMNSGSTDCMETRLIM